MRVNIIGTGSKFAGIGQDMQILHGMISHVFGETTEIRYVPHFHPQTHQAEINFFIEVINPVLFQYAAKNIWIPNPEWTYKTWEPYLHMVDEVWVKTRDAVKIFENIGVPTKYIGWTSIDKVQPEKKNYSKAILPTGKNIWRNPKPLVQAYMRIQRQDPSLFNHLPEVHIVFNPKAVPLPDVPAELTKKIKYHSEYMPEKEYDELLQDCGLCICLSAAEGFGHAVNEAMSTGCNLLLSPINAFRELTDHALWTSTSKIHEHPQCMGTLEDVDVESIVECLTIYSTSTFLHKKSMTALSRSEYEGRHNQFIQRICSELERFKETPTYSLEERLPKEADLPSVSVITITKDRRAFIPLAKYCILAQAYPEDKIEWVIVDDGNDQIKDLVSDLPNVKYVLCDESKQWTVGAKRNLGVESASHDILVMLDDDDVYPNHSVLSRVAHMLAAPSRECIFCTTIPCFDIHQKKSFVNVPPNTLTMSERVSEATLCFTRDFWRHTKFPEIQVAEAGAFIRGREHMCREMSPQEVIVSLVHNKNTSSRKAPAGESNGCHFGFSDALYTLVMEIAETLTTDTPSTPREATSSA
jgi:hypothetical protein